jgi:diaminopimelate epimerase
VIFWKYQGLGNDFIVVEDYEGSAPKDAAQARMICDRRFGIGADGVLYIGASARADASMRVINSDGSEAEMCGNGVRCVAKHLFDTGKIAQDSMVIETLAGLKKVTCVIENGQVVEVSVGMGPPELDCGRIPMKCEGLFISRKIRIGKIDIKGTAVSMGNPHFVTFDSFSREEQDRLGPTIQGMELFPRGTNVEFARVADGKIEVRVFERGAGWTMACGTGACAAAVAAALNHLVPFDEEVEVRLPGGKLWIKVNEDLSGVEMRGPAVRVFKGEV